MAFLGFLPRFLGMTPPEAKPSSPDRNGYFEKPRDEAEEKLMSWNGGSRDSKRDELPSQTMEKILKEVTFITDRMLGDDEDEQCALEWRFTAAVLDKFMLFILITFFVLSTFFIFCLTPGVFLEPLAD